MFSQGSKIGDYTIHQQLGKPGGFGIVYSVSSPSLKDKVALKILMEPDKGNNKELFEEENYILHKLFSHDHIIAPLSKVLNENGVYFYLIELADGNVEELLNGYSPSLESKINFLLNVCSGLSHAHDNDVTHRDLYWKNILFKALSSSSFTPKICDFGRAKDYTRSRTTADGDVVAGIKYITPPEVYFGLSTERDLHVKQDMYGLGMTISFIFESSPTIYNVNLLDSIIVFLEKYGLEPLALQKKAFGHDRKMELYNEWLSSVATGISKGNLFIYYPRNRTVEDELKRLVLSLTEPDYSKRVLNLSDVSNFLSKLV